MSDNELGAFLRSLREAVTPADVGLPSGTRRRTPGLRRAELATMAGISVEYLTRLEQGRDRHPSTQVLGAIADALRLSSERRLQLRWLAKVTTGDGGLCAAAEPPGHAVKLTVHALLERLEPAPAVVINRLGDVLAYTGGYEHLVRPVGLLDAPYPNVLRYLFTDSRAPAAFPDWDAVADRYVASVRTATSRADEHITELAEELRFAAGEPFAARWDGAPVLPPSAGVERLHHPEAGELRVAFEVLEISASPGQQMIVYVPDDDASSAALERLVGRRSGTLRVVGG